MVVKNCRKIIHGVGGTRKGDSCNSFSAESGESNFCGRADDGLLTFPHVIFTSKLKQGGQKQV